MKKTKRELLVLAAATTVALSMGVTVQAKGDEKVLNFGCQMYTDGCVNSANDENGGWNAMRYVLLKHYLNSMTIWKLSRGLLRVMK